MDPSFREDSISAFPLSPPRYRIETLCGHGGAGRVYRAFDQDLGRVVALKFLRDDRPDHRARMLREARAQARIDHPHVCRIFDVAEDGDRLYIAMQWIDGERLDVIGPTLSLEQKAGIVRDVADGVHAGHAEGVIHRDLKPANILVERRENGVLHPYVVDFGLARAIDDAGTTATGEIIGTPHYLSPEQAWGMPVDRRSDVYSLGATFYELLSGTPPFRGDTPTEVMMQVISRPATPLQRVMRSIPRDLSVICGTCLEKEPERRYGSARALRDDLDHWLTGEPIEARPPGLVYRAYAYIRRHRAVAAAIAAATILTGGIAGYRILQLQRERAQLEVAARLEDRVRYIEHVLDHDRALPLHDTGPAIRRASDEIRLLGNDVRFPAALAYAEGRARLTTGDNVAARTLLERAWNAGFRTPAVAYHFAVALTDEYARTLADAQRVQDSDLRRTRVAENEKTYRAAVKPLLRIARSSIEQPAALVEARIAFAAGDDARTTTLTNAVVARFPWSNEARLLQADAHIRSARSKRLVGDVTGADASFERAREAFRDASITAPSDVRIHDGLCQIAVDEMQNAGPFSTQIHADDPVRFAEARSSCERTLVADPDRASAWVALSSAWSQRSFQRQHDGDTGAVETANAWAAAERALAIAPNNSAALIQAGLTQWRMGIGHSALAAQFLRRAVVADPRSPDARHALGRALLLRNDELMSQGGDPRPALDEAIVQYKEAIRLAPNFTGAYSNLGIALTHLGRYAVRIGLDPKPFCRQAIAVLEPAIQRSPTLAEPRSISAAAWALIAESQAEKGADAEPEITNALHRYDEAIKLNPTYLGERNGRALLRLLEARVARNATTRDRSLALADTDLTFMESATPGSAALARAEWYRIKALNAANRTRAIHYIDRADTGIELFIHRLAYQNGEAWLARSRLARLRCRLAPSSCDPNRAEEYFRQALTITPNLIAEVGRARAE